MRRRNVVFGATAAVLAAAVGLLAAPARADFLYRVQMDTSALIGHGAGPFALDFQLVDGDGIANNTLTLANFVFGGGGASGTPTLAGGASGDLAGVVTLSDTAFFNALTQGFTPGSVLAFDLSTTSAFSGGAPDGFSFAILDNTGAELPTLSPAGAFFQIDLNGGAPAVQSFASDPSQAPAGGGDPISIPAPAVSAVAPEPSTLGLIAFVGAIAWRRGRRAAGRG